MESLMIIQNNLISYEVHASNLMPDIDVIILNKRRGTAMT